MNIRKAKEKDIPAVDEIYDDIHTAEESGKVTIGWIRGVVVGTGIINQKQVERYRVRAMYKKLGYSEIGSVPTYFNDIPDFAWHCWRKSCDSTMAASSKAPHGRGANKAFTSA